MKVNKILIEPGKRYGYFIARDKGDHILLQDIQLLMGSSTSYRIDKKNTNYIIQRHWHSGGGPDGIVKETKLNRNQLEKIINNSEKKYRKDHSIFNKIKKTINNFLDF